MSTDESQIVSVGDFRVEVVKKGIKNFHLGVYPPDGRVRAAAPEEMSIEAIRLAVVARLGWIRRKQKEFEKQERQSERQYIDGESHYYLGQRYRLKTVDPVGAATAKVQIKNRGVLELLVADDTSRERREAVLEDWYRYQLRSIAKLMFEKWCPKLKMAVPNWSIRKMRTKWGTCHTEDQKIWLNLELAKKPEECIEYVIVHELVHFQIGDHGDAFVKKMSQLIPKWEHVRAELNASPLSFRSSTPRADKRAEIVRKMEALQNKN